VFVVDAVFSVRGSEEKHHFCFTPDSFAKENCHQRTLSSFTGSERLEPNILHQCRAVRSASSVDH
jgi:hypothetical protein